MNSSRPYLPQVFGHSVHVLILDTLCALLLEEMQQDEWQWINISQLAEKAHVAKSSSKRIIDSLLAQDLIVERMISTHAQNPPREIRLNATHPIIKELLFFYRKIRGFL